MVVMLPPQRPPPQGVDCSHQLVYRSGYEISQPWDRRWLECSVTHTLAAPSGRSSLMRFRWLVEAVVTVVWRAFFRRLDDILEFCSHVPVEHYARPSSTSPR